MSAAQENNLSDVEIVLSKSACFEMLHYAFIGAQVELNSSSLNSNLLLMQLLKCANELDTTKTHDEIFMYLKHATANVLEKYNQTLDKEREFLKNWGLHDKK